jgi:hypothetical protein
MRETESTKLTTEDVAAAGKQHGTEAIAHPDRGEAGGAGARPDDRNGEEVIPLFSEDSVQEFRIQWKEIQTGFVDEPRRAVEQADQLVARLMQHLAQSFSDQRTRLENQWEKSDKVSTEDLRLALRRYRSFFDRLLSI